MIDTLTSTPGRIVAGSLPMAADVASTAHSVGQQLIGYAGAIIASAAVHLGLKLIDLLKKKYSKSNGKSKPKTEENENPEVKTN